jgi:hypothetical protein
MKRKDEYIIRRVAGKYVIMPTGDETFRFEGMISTNETGALLWDALAEDVTEEQLVRALRAEYDVDEATAAADVGAFLDSVRNAGLII